MKNLLKLICIVLGLIAFLFILYEVKCFLAKPVADHPYFNPENFWVIAHRGGRSLGPESTLYTFRRAVELGVDVLEIDLQRTKDGHLVILHDSTVDRTTDASGQVISYSLAELKQLDAAYYWSPAAGNSYPLRNRQIRIPTLVEVLENFPETRLNIEIKDSQPDVIASLCRLIRDYQMSEKVMIASFDAGVLKKFRVMCPEVATSAGSTEAVLFYTLQKLYMEAAYSPDAQALQVPENSVGLQVVNRRFVAAAHARNMRVHVWTVNDVGAMLRLLKLGVDGIMTDYPERLLRLLKKQQR
jgi:glycerophosphoryl diester phosphodiesterase